MAEPIDKKLIEREPSGGFDNPIPGESLTSSPDNAKSWERPPQYVNEDRAMEALYLLLTDQDKLPDLIKLIDSGTPIDEIAQIILYQGYTAGQYNPDLMLAMIEPTIYLLISIADYAEIKDYVLYEGEEDDPDTEIPGDDVTPVDMDGDGIPDEKTDEPRITKPDEDVVDKSLLSRIKTELPGKVKEATKIEDEE
tara:strand:- start:465 stop:1049 length:585 start_codon:yes stop_codon:yes gene_type:complete